MKFISYLVLRVLIISFIFISVEVSADPLVIGVEDKDWHPHYFWQDGKLDGADIEVVKAVFQRLDVEIEFKALPWKRLLKEIELKKIDGGVDLSFTKERAGFVFYPDEHLSEEGKAFYVKKGSNFKFSGNLKEVNVKNIVLMRGYNWAEILKEIRDPEVLRYDQYSQIFELLVLGRVDVFGGYTTPTDALIKKMGYADKIVMVSPPITVDKHYFGFAKKPGLKEFAKAFSVELKKFKQTEEYKAIIDRFYSE